MKPSSRRFRWAGLCLLLPLLGTPLAATADIYVIVHDDLSVTTGDLRSIYTGEKELAGGQRIRPQDNSSAQREFLSKALQLDPAKYDTLWVKKSFRDGISPPPVRTSDAEVIAVVRATPGAIGYVTTAPPSDVTVLAKY